jgi:hypothetical protein
MLWGTKQIADFQKLVKPGYAHTALGFNEYDTHSLPPLSLQFTIPSLRPDHPGQAAIDPGYASTLWWQYLEPLKSSGYRLISPAVTSAPAGKTWLSNFLGACGGCHVRSFPQSTAQAG